MFIKDAIAAGLKYITNHVITHIPSYTLRHAWYRKVLGWRIGPGASLLMNQHIYMTGVRTCGEKVRIGRGSVINGHCFLHVSGGLIIGEQVSISAGTRLVTGYHDIDDPHNSCIVRPIVIEDHAWIGVNVTILPGITIGHGAVVMAGSVVTKDVAPFNVVGGVPARVVKERKLRNPTYEVNYRPLFE